MSDVALRAARTDEAAALTDLCLRSKAHWGYDEAFMAACREELTITAESIDADICVVAIRNDAIIGTYSIRGIGTTQEVECFFVEPAHIGTGLGRVLMNDCLARARDAQITMLELDADPHAEAFYAAMGFETVSNSPSGSVPGRFLPRMRRII